MIDLVFREVLVGALAYVDDHPAAIDLVATGKVDPFQFITGRIGLDNIVAQGFDALICHEEDNVKIVVPPTETPTPVAASRP
jgi:(R,R)-butanediol dehydrogenase / meso-butanediol dehydrogenase / diacetyl reductase